VAGRPVRGAFPPHRRLRPTTSHPLTDPIGPPLPRSGGEEERQVLPLSPPAAQPEEPQPRRLIPLPPFRGRGTAPSPATLSLPQLRKKKRDLGRVGRLERYSAKPACFPHQGIVAPDAGFKPSPDEIQQYVPPVPQMYQEIARAWR